MFGVAKVVLSVLNILARKHLFRIFTLHVYCTLFEYILICNLGYENERCGEDGRDQQQEDGGGGRCGQHPGHVLAPRPRQPN